MRQTTVVCGLLGAGKTTFVQNILKQQTSEKTVVLVNDFAQTGIDGEIISRNGIETIELPNGCVCCTLKFDLITIIQRVLKQFDPAHLVIEPSGMAAASGILEALDIVKLDPVIVIGIIDAVAFMECCESGMYGKFFEDQIQNSDIILINKIDIASEEMIAGTASVVERINPGALVYRTVKARLDDAPSEKRRGPLVKTEGPVTLNLDTLSVPVRSGIYLPLVQEMFDSLANGNFGEVARAKALIQTADGPFKFDLVYGRTDCERFDAPVGKGRLVVIGKNLKKEDIRIKLGTAASHFHL
jgi:G3E family GTPase